MNEQLNDHSATAQPSSPVHAPQAATAAVQGHRVTQAAAAASPSAVQNGQDSTVVPKQRRLKVGEDLLDGEDASEALANSPTEAADPVPAPVEPTAPTTPASTKDDDPSAVPPPITAPAATAAEAGAAAPAVAAPAAAVATAPAAPAAAAGMNPMLIYGGAGAGVLVLAAAGGGSKAAAPAPTPAPADTTPPTAPVTGDIALTSTKVGANASTFNVTLAHVPTDAATVKVELLNSAGVVVATQTTGTNSVYSFSNVADGSYSARVSYTDAANNSSTAATSVSKVLDTIAPLTTNTTVGFAHTPVTPGTSTVTLTLGGVPLDATTVKVELLDSTGNVVNVTPTVAGNVYTFAGITDGAYTTRVSYTDAAGNAAVFAPTASNLGLDTIAPSTALTTVGLAHTIVSPGTSNVNVTLAGSPADAATTKVELLDSTGAVVNVTPTVAGNVYTFAGITDGAYTTRVSYTDAAQNTSTLTSTTGNVVLDTLAPAAPTVALATDTGVAGDGITSNATLQAPLGVEAGATVEYSADGLTWTPAAPVAAEGVNTVYVRQTDAAGNTSPVTVGSPTLSFTLDTLAPAAPTVALATDTGVAGDGITSNATLQAPLGVEAGATVEYSADGLTWTPAAPVAAEGVNTVYVRQIDAAGNTSPVTVGSPTLSFTLDTLAPTLATVALTNGATTPTTLSGDLTVSGLEAGATVEYLLSSAATPGVWTPLIGTTIPSPPTNGTADGLYSVQVRQTDAAGNQSVQTLTYTLSTLPLAAPGLALVSDSGVSGVDHITNNAALNVTIDPTATLVEYQVNGAGWGTTPYVAPTVGDGTAASAYTVDVRQTDARGTTSAAGTINFTLDTVAPAAAVLTLLTDTNPIGITALDGVTKASNIGVAGLNGSTVQYRFIETASGVITPWAAVTADATGAATITGPTVDGHYTLEVQQADVAGNLTTDTLVFSIDNAIVAPTASVVDTGLKDSPMAITTDGTVTLTGIDPNVAQVIYRVDGAATWTTVDVLALTHDPVTGLHQLVIPSVVANGLTNGVHTVDYYQVDQAGNSSTPALIQYTMDFMPTGLAAPLLTLNKPGPNPSFTNDGAITVTGLDPSISAVWYRINDTTAGTLGTWVSTTPTFNLITGLPISATILSPGLAGIYSVDVYQEDKAGNSSVTLPATLSFTLDTTIAGLASTLAVDTGLVPGAHITQAGAVTVSNLDPHTFDLTYTITAANGGAAASGVMPTTPGQTFATIPALDNLGNPLPDGLYNVTVTEKDQAGNTLTIAPVQYTLDTLAPGTPALGTVVAYTPGAAVPLSVPVALPLDVVAGDLVTLTFTDGAGTATTFLHTVSGIELTTHMAHVAAGGGLVDGLYTITASLTDAASNVTPAATPLSYTLDTLAPAAAIISLVTDSGALANDGITNIATLHLANPELGAQVEYRVTTAGTVGAWLGTTLNPLGDFTPTLPTDGAYTIEVRQRDAVGNISAVSATSTLALTLDTTLASPGVILAMDSFNLNVVPAMIADGITNNNSLNVSGVIEPGATATYSLSLAGNPTPVASGPVGVDALGNGVIPNNPALANGSYVVTITSTDIAGNTKLAQLPFTFDNVALAPVVTLVTDTGALPNDGITKLGAYSVTGLEPGATTTVEYSIDGATWVTTAPVAAEGLNTIYVRQTDAAGNVSPVVLGTPNLSFTLDTLAPNVVGTPMAATLGTDTASLNNPAGTNADLKTSVNSVNVAGIEPGTTVTYTIDGSTPLATGLVADGLFTPTNALGAALADGAHTVVVTQTDLAGNITSSSLSYTLDTAVAPLSLALVNDTGIVGDKITTVGSVKLVDPISGLAVTPEAGAVVEYGTMVGGVLTWATTFTAITGINDVWVRQTDLAGNVSVFDPALPALTFTMSGAGPAPSLAVTDTGSIDTPVVVTTTSTITATPGVVGSVDYEYSLDNGVTWIRVLAPVGGVLTILDAAGAPLVDGTYTVMVHSLDPVTAIASGDAQVTFIQDTASTTVAAALTVDSFTAINFNGTNADLITNDGRLTISNVDPNLDSITVTYTRTDALGVVSTQTVTAPALAVADPLVAGQFLTTIAAPTLGDGVYSASIVQTDKAGNATTATPFTATFTLDTTLALPLVTLVTDTANPTNPATALDGITNLSDLLVANVEPGAVVDFTVTDAAGVVVGLVNNTVAVDPVTNTAAILAAINTGVGGSPDGAYTITVTQTDVAGNQKSQALPLVIDTAISTLTATLVTDTASALNPAGTATDMISQVGDVVIGGLDPHVDVVNYTLTVTDSFGTALINPATGLLYPTVTGSFIPVAGALNHTLTAANLGLTNGTYTLSLDQIDKAGNSTLANATTTPFTFTYDTVALPPVVAPTVDSALLGYTGVYPAYLPTLGTDLNNVTNVSDLTFSGLEVGAAVTYSITNTLTGAVVMPATLVPVDPLTGTASAVNPIATNIPGVNDGTYAVTVTQTDLAGNTNTATSSYVIDTLINPLTGSVSLNGVLAPVPDGVTIFDRVGVLGQFTLNGLDPNVDRVYYVFTPVDPISGASNGSPVIAGSMVPIAGATSMTLLAKDPALGLIDGAYTVDFWQVDKAGNSSLGVPVTMNFALDTTVVAPTVILLSDTGDTVTNPIITTQDGITANSMPNPQGGAEPGGVIQYSLDGINWVLDTGVAALTTVDGPYNFFVRQTDLVGNVATSAGNTAATGGYEFILDTQKPLLTLAADPLTSTVVGGVIHSSTGAISVATGVDPHPSSYVYSIDGGVTWTPDLATLPATITAKGVVSGQTLNVDVIQIDAAGNGVAQMVPGGKDTSITLLIDKSSPLPLAQLTADTGTFSTDGVSINGAITASATETGAALTYSTDGGATWTPWTGTYAIPATAVVDPVAQQTSFAVAFQQTDALGNISQIVTVPVTLDAGAAAPTVQVLTMMDPITGMPIMGNTGATSDLGLLNVVGEMGATVQVSTNGGTVWQDINSFVPVVGANNLLVHQTDLAGNISPNTTFSFTLAGGYSVDGAGVVATDATVNQPVIGLTDTGLVGDNITNNGSLVITPQFGADPTDLVEFSSDGGLNWINVNTLGMPLGDSTYSLLFRESTQTADPVNIGMMVTHYSPSALTTLTVDTVAPTVLTGAAELFTSASGTSNAVAVLQVQYGEGATIDATNMAAFGGAGALGYTTSVASSGVSMDGQIQLGLQSDGTTRVELRFTETVLNSFSQSLLTVTPITAVGQLSVSDIAGNSTAATPAVDLNGLGATWQVLQTLP
jgi:hypothetical protein